MARTDQDFVDHARSLRKRESAAEQLLWERLRNRRLNGLKFVRQLSTGPFIADFACRDKRLIVEVDGATHSTEKEIAHDRRRDEILIRAGWNVLRVSNHDVLTAMDGVLETILNHCGKP
jgi:very-short-patch-repair endonuclease